jgi:hypothetical protein
MREGREEMMKGLPNPVITSRLKPFLGSRNGRYLRMLDTTNPLDGM